MIACQGNIQATQSNSGDQEDEAAEETATESFYIESVSPVYAKSGEELLITGEQFTDEMSLHIGTTELNSFRLLNDKEIRVAMPNVSQAGKIVLKLSKGHLIARFQFFTVGTTSTHLMVAETPSDVCVGENFLTLTGEKKVGTRVCNPEEAPEDCSVDSQVGCTTTQLFPSVDKAHIDPWNIRVGKSLVGVAGSLKVNCRNRANSAIFNLDPPFGNTVVTNGTNIDWWDTIDDWNNDGAFPTSFVTGWTSSTDCDRGVWKDLTADGACDSAADDCLIEDRLSGLTWSESYPASGAAAGTTGVNWSTAVSRCDALSFCGYSDWRLPTQKELMESYIHGIREVGYKGTGTVRGNGSLDNNSAFLANVDIRYWAATTASDYPLYTWYVIPYSGYTNGTNRTDLSQVACVRP